MTLMRTKIMREDNGVPTMVQNMWLECREYNTLTVKAVYFDGLDTSISIEAGQINKLGKFDNIWPVLELEFERKWINNARRKRNHITIDVYGMDKVTPIKFLTD